MIEIPGRLPRRPSRSDDPATRDAYDRFVEEDYDRRFRQIAERASDKTDVITFESTGEDEEVLIMNRFGFVPTEAVPCRMPYPYTAGQAREDLADKDFIYMKTSAPKGVKFRFRFERV